MTDILVQVGKELGKFPFSSLKPSQFHQGAEARPVTVRCPHCSAVGVFPAASGGSYLVNYPTGGGSQAVSIWLGVRFCPGNDCGRAVFMAAQQSRVLAAFPPLTIDFDSANLPELVKSSLEEAIRCHASGCYRASALLIRRTLEEVCKDRGATGDNLKNRIADLKGKITLPNELFEAMDRLRLLGNDAAHIEAQSYDNVGEEEVEVGLELTKEIVKATYQYGNLLSRLAGLGKS